MGLPNQSATLQDEEKALANALVLAHVSVRIIVARLSGSLDGCVSFAWQLSQRKLILPRFHCHRPPGMNGLPRPSERVGRSLNKDECLFTTHWSIAHLNRSPFGKTYRESPFLLHPYVPSRVRTSAREVRCTHTIPHRSSVTVSSSLTFHSAMAWMLFVGSASSAHKRV